MSSIGKAWSKQRLHKRLLLGHIFLDLENHLLSGITPESKLDRNLIKLNSDGTWLFSVHSAMVGPTCDITKVALQVSRGRQC